MPKFMCPILIFPNTLCLLIKITNLIELWPLNLSLLFGLLPVDYSFSSWKLYYAPKYLVLIRQVNFLKPFGFFLITFSQKKKKKKEERFPQIYLYHWLCMSPGNIFYQLQILRPMQCFPQSFWECVNHPRHCVFGIALAYVTLHWISLANFPKTSSSSTQSNIRYPWYFVFNFDLLQCFSLKVWHLFFQKS